MQSIFPIPYAIPDEYIVDDVPEKKHIWAEVIPDFKETYRFGPNQEIEYNQMYRDSRFAFTWKKCGWDSLRHYEIIANGCIPVFRDLHKCPEKTMISFPKQIVSNAMKDLIPWKENDEYIEKYNSYVKQLLQWCRDKMSCSALAKYFIDTIKYTQIGSTPKILFINCEPNVNYTREFLFIGLSRLLKKLNGLCISWPPIPFLYEDYPINNLQKHHGMGFGYGRRLPAIENYNENYIIQSIKDKSWDYIVYAKIGVDEGKMGTIPHSPLWSIVSENYNSDRIIFLNGSDRQVPLLDTANIANQHLMKHAQKGICFVRELV